MYDTSSICGAPPTKNRFILSIILFPAGLQVGTHNSYDPTQDKFLISYVYIHKQNLFR